MKKWILKAIVQKVISYLPARNKINYIFQKYVTKGVFLSDVYFTDRLEHASEHIDAYNRYCPGVPLQVSLELGTGWYPVVPISFFLYGLETIYTVDIAQLSNKDRIIITIQKFKEYEQNGTLNKYLKIQPERWQVLMYILDEQQKLSFEEITKRLHIIYLIQDARHLSLKDNSIDLVNSNNTFEHIYPGILAPILMEFVRVIKQNGVMSHFIDMSDHFAHFDRSINIYNYLRFSEQQWKWIDNSIQPQNRMRITEYKVMYAQLNIPITEESSRPGYLEELKEIKLNAKYKNIPITEVAKSHCQLVSKM